MPKVRSFALVVLFGVAACGDSSTGPRVATIVVSPTASTIGFLGSNQQFTARAEDASGAVLTGVTFTWTTGNPAVATVDQSGRATALSAGTAQISASAGGITGQASLTVDPAPCSTEVTLNPGEWQVLPVDCAITLPSGAPGDRYRVAVLNQNLVENASLLTDVSVQVASIDAPAAPSASGTVAQPVSGGAAATRPRLEITPRQAKHLRWAESLRRRTQAVHRRIRAVEAALVESLGPEVSLVSRTYEGAALSGPAAQTTLPAKLQLRANSGSTCQATVPLATALLVAQNADMAIYQDSTQNATAAREVTAAQAQRILNYYSNYGKAAIEQYFPGVPDIDGNGKIILYVSFDDSLDDGATAAYVFGGDLLPTSGAGACATSNERELVYFNAALIRALDDGFDQALETTVHEVKHISSFRHGIARADWWGFADPFQPDWIEEGTAEIAGNISSRRAWAELGGPTAAARIGETELIDHYTANGNEFAPEVFGVLLRLSRAQEYLASQPNGLIVTPDGARDGASYYGSGWTFMRWLGDAYGNAASAPYADASLFAAMNDSLTAPGTQGIEAQTGKTIQALMEEFAAGVMLHMTPSEGSDLAYTSYDFLSAIEIFCFSSDDPSGPCEGTGPSAIWPWPVTATSKDVLYAPFQNGTFNGTTGPTGLRIHEFRSAGTGLGLAVRVTAAQPSKVVIARTN